MITYPLKFPVNSHSESGAQSRWTSSVRSDDALTCAIPAEFQGPGGGYSPEDFFALAVSNCFVATFKVIAEKSRLSYDSIALSGELTVDRDAHGKPWMSEMLLKITLRCALEAHERALRLLDKVSQSCLVVNSVRTQVSFQFQLEHS